MIFRTALAKSRNWNNLIVSQSWSISELESISNFSWSLSEPWPWFENRPDGNFYESWADSVLHSWSGYSDW